MGLFTYPSLGQAAPIAHTATEKADLIRNLNLRVKAGVYEGATPEGHSCRVRVTKTIEAPVHSKYYDPATGLDARPIDCSRLAYAIARDNCFEKFDPGPDHIQIGFAVESVNRSWVDRAAIGLRTDSPETLGNGQVVTVKGAPNVDGREGARSRFILRVVKTSPENRAYYSRRQIRGAATAKGMLSWIEISRKDSADVIERFPRLKSQQNEIRCQNLQTH